jgi:hypothetical protein
MPYLVETNAPEVANGDTLQRFMPSGFIIGDDIVVNTDTEDYWSLLLGNSGSTSPVLNEVGVDIDSMVWADEDSGISLVKWTGTGTNQTIGHGCKVNGVATKPKFIWVKARSTNQNGIVYHEFVDATAPEEYYLVMDNSGLRSTSPTDMWGTGGVAPTTTVFSVATANQTNQSGIEFEAICICESDVFTFGTYEGNAVADGTFIPTDELEMVLTKNIDSSTAGSDEWFIHDQQRDPFNSATTEHLWASIGNLESDAGVAANTTCMMDFLPNGFKIRASNVGMNRASTFIYFGIKKRNIKYS